MYGNSLLYFIHHYIMNVTYVLINYAQYGYHVLNPSALYS
jgi:hypothetical protein